MPLTRTQRRVVVAGLLSALITLVIVLSSARFAYRNLEARVAIETAQGMVALIAAGLVGGRFLRTRARRDLLLLAGLATLALVAVLVAAMAMTGPDVSSQAERSVGRWAPLAGQLVAAATIGAAALSRDAVVAGRRRAAGTVAAIVGTAVVLGVALLLLDGQLPPAIEALDPANATRARFDPHPGMVASQVALVAAFSVSAWAFAWRIDEHDPDGFTEALAVGAVLAAASRVNLLLYPTDLIAHVHVADVFRLGFFAALAVGAGASIRHHWETEAQAAQLRAREQLARELHDGLAQELGFIASQASTLASGRGDGALVDHIALAAERARAEARQMVDALQGIGGRPLRAIVAEVVRPLADRHGATVHVRHGTEVVLDPRTSHEIGQIAREATSNAVRHGDAREVVIDADQVAGELRVTVRDDGIGFDRSQIDRRGFGLRSMEQRAAHLGGSLAVRSEPGAGTTVELVVPIAPTAPNGRRTAGGGPS